MANLEQHHSGDGDNVAGDKIINQIRSIAPNELVAPIEMVFESLRQKEKEKAKAQMGMLKAVAQREEESAALVEVISIYGGLVEAQDRDAAWSTVARIVSRATNPMIRDVCQAALLQLSYGGQRAEEAKALYVDEGIAGGYAQEAYLRLFADEEALRAAAGTRFPAEGVLTGMVEGTLRLRLPDLAVDLAARLTLHYTSYNARVLSAQAAGVALNPLITVCHFWLSRPEVKSRVDELRDQVIGLLGESGTDGRVHDLGCSIFKLYQGYQVGTLFDALKRNLHHLDASRSDEIAKFRALAGDDSGLSPSERDVQAAYDDPLKRQAWCRVFLTSGPHTLETIGPFIHLARPSELIEWLAQDPFLTGASEVEEAYIRLVASIFQCPSEGDNRVQRHETSEYVDRFVSTWGELIPTVAPMGIFELAEKLLALQLPHRALQLTSPLVPTHELWPSPYVLIHLNCLQDAGQNKTLEEVVARIEGGQQSLPLLSFQSVQAEQGGDSGLAIAYAKSMVELAPTHAHAWYRYCYLLDRYRGPDEQRELHAQIPDTVLLTGSREVTAILFYMSLSGSFKRAEARWIDWMLKDPRSHAIDFVNFHFGLSARKHEPMEVSLSVDRCLGAVQFAHEDDRSVRLIVVDEQEGSECTLKASSQLGQMLLRLAPGESDTLNMTKYMLEERLPPYVACLRIALRLRHTHNDGNDCFAMMQMPDDPAEFIPFLEERMAQGEQQRRRLEAMEAIPLYMRGHGLHPSDPFKAALNCWGDSRVPKSPLCDVGEEAPSSVVLDAYGISYLAVTNLARSLLEAGISVVLPASTKERLEQFLDEVTSERFTLVGLNDAGKLFRTTASDLRERDGHVLDSLRLILDNATVLRPDTHDAELEIFSVKEAVDPTMYEAMQLSIANQIAWFCMDSTFGALHHVKGHRLANVQSVLTKTIAGEPFDFAQRRHALALFAMGALPLPVTFNDIYDLARTSNTLAGLVFLKIIQTHGRQIFTPEGRAKILLNAIFLHLDAMFGNDAVAVNSPYSPWVFYTSHVFNHGLSLYLGLIVGSSVEFKMAKALVHMAQLSVGNRPFLRSLVARFIEFAQGHFMDWELIREHFHHMAQPRSLHGTDTDEQPQEPATEGSLRARNAWPSN